MSWSYEEENELIDINNPKNIVHDKLIKSLILIMMKASSLGRSTCAHRKALRLLLQNWCVKTLNGKNKKSWHRKLYGMLYFETSSSTILKFGKFFVSKRNYNCSFPLVFLSWYGASKLAKPRFWASTSFFFHLNISLNFRFGLHVEVIPYMSMWIFDHFMKITNKNHFL